MSGCWDLDLTPRACPGLAAAIGALHAGVAVVPWVAGCAPGVAAGLSAVALLACPFALRAIPGRTSAIRRLRRQGSRWSATLADGIERRAELLPGSRVLPAFVFCRIRLAGQKLDWWLPAYAVSATGFRRLKVALRCQPQAAGSALLDSNLFNHEEAARPGPDSRRAN